MSLLVRGQVSGFTPGGTEAMGGTCRLQSLVPLNQEAPESSLFLLSGAPDRKSPSALVLISLSSDNSLCDLFHQIIRTRAMNQLSLYKQMHTAIRYLLNTLVKRLGCYWKNSTWMDTANIFLKNLFSFLKGVICGNRQHFKNNVGLCNWKWKHWHHQVDFLNMMSK